MDIKQAKLDVIKAGHMLCEKGLIQRTWGNVSCRIDEKSFAITPSGRDYLSLTPEDIVIVDIDTLSYDGNIKPSSEKGIHAAGYKLRPEVNFIIHTHQTFASLAGLRSCDINHIDGESSKIIGLHIPLATYGLPGTKPLRDGVAEAISRSSSKAVLMHHHGALCLGNDLEDAFAVANEVEEVCQKLFFDKYKELTGKVAENFDSLSRYISSSLVKDTSANDLEVYNSTRNFGVLELVPEDGSSPIEVDIDTGRVLDTSIDSPAAAEIHSRIYRKRKDVNAIIHSKEPATVEVSKTGLTIKPFLDDFAQIVGINLKNATVNPNSTLASSIEVMRKLKGRDAVLIKHNGALCVGSDEEEADAVRLVTEKGCKAFVAAKAYGKDNEHISTIECAIMRFVYKTKYSKKK